MKIKNFNSAIHNFAHSFQSIDMIKSPKYAVNILIELRNKGIDPIATFDFVNQLIEPIEANTKSSKQLLEDYSSWLPQHFNNHNCDLKLLEKLKVTIEAEFDGMVSPVRTNDGKELVVKTSTKWKLKGKEEQLTNIQQTELIRTTSITHGIPEIE